MLTDLRQFLETLLLAVAALLPIVNPLGGAPIYLAKTSDLSPEAHTELSRRVAVNCFMLLLYTTDAPIVRARASIEFSRSSFTAAAGRWTTSPAAILLARFSGSMFMVCGIDRSLASGTPAF